MWPNVSHPAMLKCLWHFCDASRYRTSEKPHHESVWTFFIIFETFFKCFNVHFVLVIFRFCTILGAMEMQLLRLPSSSLVVLRGARAHWSRSWRLASGVSETREWKCEIQLLREAWRFAPTPGAAGCPAGSSPSSWELLRPSSSLWTGTFFDSRVGRSHCLLLSFLWVSSLTMVPILQGHNNPA